MRAILASMVWTLAATAQAQLPQPVLDVVYPLGGAAGSKVVVEVGGKDLDTVRELRFDRPGFAWAPTKNPKQFEVTIGPDVPPGSFELRVVTDHGISAARLFAVSRGLAEVLEKEPNDAPESAQAVPLNAVVNGRCDGNGDDFFRFAARKGQRVTVDVAAFRLDSTLRAQLTLSDARGKALLASRPYFDRVDPFLDFVAPDDGEYVVRLHDAIFSGGLPYRLTISDRPHLEGAAPWAIRAGEDASLAILGRNLPGGKASDVTVLDLPLERFEMKAKSPTRPFGFESPMHLLSPSVNARGLQFWPAGLDGALNPATVAVVPEPVVSEAEPNDSAEAAQALTLPVAVVGSLSKPGDADWYRFVAKAGDAIAIDLLSERLGMPGDPFLLVVDEKGAELQSLDDHGINQRAIAQFNRDPVGTFKVPKDGTYRLFVQDRYRHGSPRSKYVLRVRKATPDFFPVAFHETNPDPTCPTVRAGGSAFAEVCLNRRDLTGPVVVEARGLPPGVVCPPVFVSPQSQTANVVFTAAPNAAEWTGAVTLVAWATVDGDRLERDVRVAQRRWRIANVNTCVAVREFCLAVRPGAPYALQMPTEPATVKAGETVELGVTLVRHWADATGKVGLSALNAPPGFAMPALDVGAGQTSAKVKVTVAANVPAGDYSFAVRGDAQVPYAKDGKTKVNVRVADPSTAALVRVVAAKK